MNLESEKIKIIFAGRYNSNEILSGPQKVAKRIFTGLYGKTNSVFIEYFFDGEEYSIWKKLFGKEIITDFQNSKIFRLGIFQTLLCIIKFKPKIVHIFSFERFVTIIFLLKFIFRLKVSYTVNGIVAFEDSTFQKKIGKALLIKDRMVEWLILKYSDKLFFLSKESVTLAKKYYTVAESKVILTSNGIDKIFNQTFIEKQYKDKNKLNVVIVADPIRKEKGLDFFFNAIQSIKLDFNFNIIGEKTITFDKINYYSKMPTNKFAKFLLNQDIFISSSFFDTFSITTLEAMAAGVIPIVTKETGVSRFIVQGENGFVYSYGDVETLLSYLLKIKDDFNLRQRLSKNAAMIYKKFLWEDIYNNYLEIFYKMLHEK